MPLNDESTTKLGIPWPSSAVPANLSGILQELAQYLDGIIAQAKQVTSLPAAGKFGSIYELTTTGEFFLDDGTSMVGPLAVLDSRVADISASAPGDTGAVGSTGFAADAGHRHPRETAATALAGAAGITTFTQKLIDLGNMGAAKTLDLSQANSFKGVLNANCSVLFSNIPSAAGLEVSWSLKLKQDATGGRTASWPSNVDWGVLGPPALTTTPNKVDYLSFVTHDGGTTIGGFVGLQGGAF